MIERTGPDNTVRGRQRQRGLHMEPRPDEIAMLRFSRTLFGVHPGQVRHALFEIAASLNRSRAEFTQARLEHGALERALEAASSTIEELQHQLAAARAELCASQKRERMLTRELLAAGGAQRQSRRSRQSADTEPDEIVAVARHSARTIVEAAWTAALEVLRAARAAAQTMRRSADVGPAAEPAPRRR